MLTLVNMWNFDVWRLPVQVANVKVHYQIDLRAGLCIALIFFATPKKMDGQLQMIRAGLHISLNAPAFIPMYTP